MTSDRLLGLPQGHVFTDHLQVTPDECVEHVAHHLRLAMMFYQSTPEDLTAVNTEIARIIEEKRLDSGELAIVWAFLDAIKAYYDQQEADSDDRS